jgi:hypothetical protein
LFTTHYGRDEVSVKYVPDFVVEMTNEVPLKQSLRLLHHLRNFLALAVSHPVYPDSIDGFTDSVKATLTDGTTVCRQIKILYRRVNWGVSHDSVNINGMLFKLSDVRSEFESLLKNWFDKIDVLEPVFDMYFGVMYNPGMYVQHVFLSLVQCVESYHRRVVHNYELPLDQAEKRKKDILNAVPVEHMEWLKNKLRHSNDLTLRKRLQELLTTYSFLELDETGTFIDDVINTRNYLTHYDKELKTLAVIPEKISTLSMKLRLLTEAILLTELGLSPDTVKFIMKQIKEHRSQIRSYDF